MRKGKNFPEPARLNSIELAAVKLQQFRWMSTKGDRLLREKPIETLVLRGRICYATAPWTTVQPGCPVNQDFIDLFGWHGSVLVSRLIRVTSWHVLKLR